jgi:uncharacterized oxidoreductase
MKTTNNTVLIIGGTAGIGLEIAKLLDAGNKVIITGRNKERLDKALSQLPNATGIVNDFSKKEDAEALAKLLKADFPELNVVINNGAHAEFHNFVTDVNGYESAEREMATNYLSVIRVNELLLPLLLKQQEAAVVNVTSVVAYVPGSLVGYSASKAALHSYTQSFREALRKSGSSIKVFELLPPLVDTDFSAPIGGDNGIPPLQVAQEFLEGFASDDFEIKVGGTKTIYELFLTSPQEAFKLLNS